MNISLPRPRTRQLYTLKRRVWKVNTHAQEVDNYQVLRVMLGINPFGFQWKLDAAANFTTPEAVMVYSNAGLNGMSQQFHRLYQNRLVRGYWRDRERPVLHPLLPCARNQEQIDFFRGKHCALVLR